MRVAPLRPRPNLGGNLPPTWIMADTRPSKGMCDFVKNGVLDLLSSI
jgi:hypothetical protein